MTLRSMQSVQEARNLFWLAIAHQPDCATAWAWLGRASRFLEKFGVERAYHRQIALISFQRAFAIDPDSGAAHQFYTTLQTDRGQGLEALSRLLDRVRKHPEDAHNFSALVQVCRFCGLLTASEQAHKRAVALDRAVTTSLPHTYFARCDYHAVIEAYAESAGSARNYLDVSAWACLGFKERTELEIARRLSAGTMAPIFEALLTSLLFALRGDSSEVQRICLSLELYEDAETSLYLARHLAFSGCIESGLTFVRQAIEGGLAIPEMLRRDEWLRPLRGTAQFESLLKQAIAIERDGERRLAEANLAQLSR